MASTKLDGAGAQKLKTLEEALMAMGTIHAMVERTAMDMKNGKSMGVFPMQLKRVAAPLVGMLKGQFGMISDQVSAMLLISGRGGGDQVKLRAYREAVANIKQLIDFAQKKVKVDHAVAIELAPE